MPPEKAIVARNKKYVPLNIMQEIRKVDCTWQFEVGGEWQDAHVEPNWDGKGFGWPDLELKGAGKKGLGVFAARDFPQGHRNPYSRGEKRGKILHQPPQHRILRQIKTRHRI